MAEGKPDLGQVEHATVALLVKWTLNGYQRTLKGYQCMAMARDSVLLAIECCSMPSHFTIEEALNL